MASSKFDIVGFMAGLLGGFSQQLQQERRLNEERSFQMLRLMQANENVDIAPVNPADVAPTGGILGALTGTGGGRLRRTGEQAIMVGGTPFVQRPVGFIQAPPGRGGVTPPTPGTAAAQQPVPAMGAATPQPVPGAGVDTMEPVTVTPDADILATVEQPTLTEVEDLAEAQAWQHIATSKILATPQGKKYAASRIEKARADAAKTYEQRTIQARREADQLLKRVHSPEVRAALEQAAGPEHLKAIKAYMAANPEPNYVQQAAATIRAVPPEQRADVIATEYGRLLEQGYTKEVIEAQIRPFMKDMELQEKGQLEEYLGNIRNRQRYELAAALHPLQRQVARETGLAAALQKPMEFQDRRRLQSFDTAMATLSAMATEFTPEERKKYVGLFGLRMKAKSIEEAIKEATGQETDPKFHRFGALVAIALREIRGEAGANLTQGEQENAYGWLPSGKEWTAEALEQKLQFGLQRLPRDIERSVYLLKTPLGQVTPQSVIGAPYTTPGAGAAKPAKAAPGTAAAPAIPSGMKKGQTLMLPDGTKIERID